MEWATVVAFLVKAGVNAITIHEALQQAKLDDEQIDALRPLWDTLIADTERASHPPVE